MSSHAIQTPAETTAFGAALISGSRRAARRAMPGLMSCGALGLCMLALMSERAGAPVLGATHTTRTEFRLLFLDNADEPEAEPASVSLAEASWKIALASGAHQPWTDGSFASWAGEGLLLGSLPIETALLSAPVGLAFETETEPLEAERGGNPMSGPMPGSMTDRSFEPTDPSSAFAAGLPSSLRRESPAPVYFGRRQGLRATSQAGRPSALDGSADITLNERADVGAPTHAYAGPGGTFEMYDMGLRFDASDLGPVDIDFIGGIQAVHALVRASNGSAGGPSDAEGFVAIPVLGTQVSWAVNPWFKISGRATTQALDAGGSLTDFTAQARFILTEKIDLETGYQDVRGSFNVRGVDATLDESGVFARISIEF